MDDRSKTSNLTSSRHTVDAIHTAKTLDTPLHSQEVLTHIESFDKVSDLEIDKNKESPDKMNTKEGDGQTKTSTPNLNIDRKPRASSATIGMNNSERIIRNQSDIFSLKETSSITTSIFSVNGAPSRKLHRKKELPPNNVFPNDPFANEEPPYDKLTGRDRNSYNDLKRPSSSIRNPLTGTGLSSNDEYKFKGTKRKDGNPLLGLGYTPEAAPSTHRIPPGGFSHKLW